MLHYTLHYCLQKKRQDKAHKKLLLAIEQCTVKQELDTLLLFGKFLQEETSIQQAYRKRLRELEQSPSAIIFLKECKKETKWNKQHKPQMA